MKKLNRKQKIGIALLTFLVSSLLIFSGAAATYIMPGIMSATVFSSTYDTATPLGTDAPSSIDDQIRLTKAAIQERMNVDHYWPLSGTQVSDADAGEHRKVLFHAPIAATPTVAANHGDLRIADVSGVAEFHWTDENEAELQITDGGTLNIISADLLGTVANDTYFTAVDNAGTGTVDLIKANASDVAVLPDASELATSAAPTSDADISNKKYVDDNIGSANWTPTSYTGGESVTFPNGLIMKQGTIVLGGAGSGDITFGTQFPTALFVAFASGAETAATGAARVTDRAANVMTVRGTASRTYNWMAVGY